MAFRQSAETINEWITYYGGKKKLYAKDISEDLVWLYLINAKLKDESRKLNYYRSYEEYQSAAYSIFRERWDEIILNNENTADVEIALGQAEFGPEFDGLRDFVAEHMDAFKTAYSRTRKYLDRYVESILTVCRSHPTLSGLRSLNAMRGYLDDSIVVESDEGYGFQQFFTDGRKGELFAARPKGMSKLLNWDRLGLMRVETEET